MDGVPCNGIARLNSDGSFDASFVSPFYEAFVHAITLQPDGGILVGGDLYLSNQGSSKRIIIGLGPNGGAPIEFLNLNSPHFDTSSNVVYSIAIESDGSVIIGARAYVTVGCVAGNTTVTFEFVR